MNNCGKMNFKKVLPICIKPYITSECWTFYKFSVLQTNDTYKKWVLNFMNLWTDANGVSFFGNPKERNLQSVYSEILEIKDGHLMECPPEQVVDYVISLIDAGYYIVLDVNYDRLFQIESGFYLHEVLIYGYDCDAQRFYSPLMRDGVFKESTIDFQVIREAYADAFKYYNEDHNNLFWRRYWTYGIMMLKPREYTPDVDYHFDFIRAIRDEKNGCKYQRTTLDNDMKEENTVNWITGIPALILLSELLNKAYQDDNYFREYGYYLRMTCLKLYEHQSIISLSMREFAEEFDTENELSEYISNYEECCAELHKMYLLFLKCAYSNDKSLLLSISSKLKKLYLKEKQVLDLFDEPAAQIYIRENLMKAQEKQ